MKKLDNRGFSLGIMITFICVFMFFLIVVSLLCFNFGVGKDSPDPLYEVEEEDADIHVEK